MNLLPQFRTRILRDSPRYFPRKPSKKQDYGSLADLISILKAKLRTTNIDPKNSASLK